MHPNINDIKILEIETSLGVWKILNESDHLLRRFGFLEYHMLSEPFSTYTYREKADEIWAIIHGEAEMTVVDLREKSPSHRLSDRIMFRADRPTAALIPFGVAYKIAAPADGQFIRLSTHAYSTDEGDRQIPVDEIILNES